MSQTEPVIEDSRAVEDLHHLRLMALLHELVREKGNRGAASGAGSAASRQRERNDALEGRSEEMEGKLRSGIEEVRAAVAGEVEALREEHARSMRHVERRLVRLEAGRSESETPSPTGAETEPTKRRYVRPRTYPQLVTPEAEPDEDLVYGEAAPVIVEWRRVRAEFLKTGATLDRTEVQEPMLEMEIALVGEHELTLPPASFPWDQFDRRDKVWELTQDLKRVRAERNRALLRRWLRRVLTFGLWRN